MNGRPNILYVCGTVLLLAAIGAVLYLSSTTAPDLAALGIIGTIVASVLAGTFGVVQLGSLRKDMTRVVEQTNGGLDQRMRQSMRDVLDENGLLLRGPTGERGRTSEPPGPAEG